MTKRLMPLILVLTTLCLADTDLEDWTKHCNHCKCVWANGKKTADCTDKELNQIPNDLSTQIREIDFSFNPLYELGIRVFIKANLPDMHRLKFQNCSLESVDKTAFEGLRLLIELDLSKNNLSKLNRDTFRDNLKLRILTLSHNKLTRIESGLFYNLTHLQRIVLNDNEINWLGNQVFEKLPSLQHINLANNKLTQIMDDFTSNLIKLNSLNLEGNPWICDCHLEKFRNKMIANSLITTPTGCAEPPRLRKSFWSGQEVFACMPVILEPLSKTLIEASSTNMTLVCKVTADPEPDVNWVLNGRVIARDARQINNKYVISKSIEPHFTWNNLTIVNVNYRDKGEYKCVAKNPAGEDEQNINLMVPSDGNFGSGGYSHIMKPIENFLPILICAIVSMIFLIIILTIILCRCRKQVPRGGTSGKGGDNESSSEYINLHGQPDMEKALITDVNPVVKPPRFVVPTPIGSGGTEVSEVKKNLLDNDSTYIGDDESRSLDFDQTSRKIDNLLELSRHPYPPDLLPPFHRAAQVSPAASNASTVPDNTRLHPMQNSPLHSPHYDYIYRTMPHSRSHSPFVPVQPLVPRQGYVTIPRRPRQMSWSSEPPPEIGEPLYDNLGKRTTATGSSALNLNKIETPTLKTRNRALSPNSCDPIAENENSPPVLTTNTLPNRRLSPSSTKWAKANAEAFQTPERRNSLIVFPSSDQKPTKIPPRPPPKPKKKTSGPLFEDEGEDGTEV